MEPGASRSYHHHHGDTMSTDFRALCAELLQPLAEYDGANPYHEHRALITRARAALAAEPGGEGLTVGLPANYIDPEHQGDDRELLETFYGACNAEGGTAEEIHLRGIRAVLAARPTAPPAPETDDGDVAIDRWIESRPDWPNGWPGVTQCQLTALIGEALEHWGRPTTPPAPGGSGSGARGRLPTGRQQARGL